MPSASGIVAKINAKQVDEDQFGNSFLRSFKIEGDDRWFGLGKGKNEKFNIKVGKDFYSVQEGDEIEFMFDVSEYNGKEYCNVKSSKVVLRSKGGGGASPAKSAASAAAAPKQASAAPTAPRASDAGIKVGHAINNAVQIAIASGMQTDMAEIAAFARDILKLSKKLEGEYMSIVTDAPVAEAPATKAEKPKAQEPAKPVSEFDDDIPF